MVEQVSYSPPYTFREEYRGWVIVVTNDYNGDKGISMSMTWNNVTATFHHFISVPAAFNAAEKIVNILEGWTSD